MESEQSVHARSVHVSEILYPRPFPVDIIVRTPAEVAERIALGDGFFREIMALAVKEIRRFARSRLGLGTK